MQGVGFKKMKYRNREFREFENRITWQLNIDDVIIVLLDIEHPQGNNINCIGFDSNTLLAKWELGGRSIGDVYDAVVDFYINMNEHSVYAFTFSCIRLRLDHHTGEILEEVFTK